jgi:anionic cell wall polymer biosynthesis LytR-Cps2A-Psr (LCP) family protein
VEAGGDVTSETEASAQPTNGTQGVAPDGGSAGARVGTPGHTAHEVPEVVSTAPRVPRSRRRWRRWVLIALGGIGLAILALVLYGLYSYRAFADAIGKAHGRLSPSVIAQLGPGDALGQPQVTLVVFDRSAAKAGRPELFSTVLIRTDPDSRRNSLLAIPTELTLPDPAGDLDASRIYARGGLNGLLRALQRETAISVSHVVQVDVDGIGGLIDGVGGVTIHNPVVVAGGGGHASYPKGRVHLDGTSVVDFLTVHRPLNVQAGVQLAVVRSFAHRLLKPSAILHLPAIGRSIAHPLATDLSAADMLRLSWVAFRSGGTTQCHLGGAPAMVEGRRVVEGTEQNAQVVQMFLGAATPRAASDVLRQAPGCGDVEPSSLQAIVPSNCGIRAGGACPTPPPSYTGELTPLLAWPAYPGARRYGVRVGTRPPVYPRESQYRIVDPLPVDRATQVFVYAYTKDHPDGFAIGAAVIHPVRATGSSG